MSTDRPTRDTRWSHDDRRRNPDHTDGSRNPDHSDRPQPVTRRGA